MLLDDAMDALEAADPNTFYGTANALPKGAPWDFTVLKRGSIRRTGGKTGYSDSLVVVIVRERYIPDGLAERVVEAMEQLPGINLVKESEHPFDYEVNPQTGNTCEMLTLSFARARKS